ncbi:MAG: DegT/DnrJ/EryC1/StrS family aminotransferase, partial [Bryobacteraceae bacterium]|nr:DegT/DnrJ/EryC1/StrS family aminotransferase [Bryobacteraceae bacterium]
MKRLAPEVRSEVAAAVQRVLDHGWYVLGPELEAFENEFASYTGARFCIGVGNGTDALELALRATGVRPGSRVATIASAGMYATTAILACGAIPVWIDVQPGTSHMNLEQLSTARPDLQAVVATHLYGQMEPMPEVLDAAGSVPVIEDCAQAHGASLQGRQAGTWGIAGCFSFYPTKNLGAFGDGGAVITSDAEIAGTIRALRQYGWTAKYASSVQGGRNSRLDEMQAAVLRAKLPYLDRWNQRRREIAEAYGLVERPS